MILGDMGVAGAAFNPGRTRDEPENLRFVTPPDDLEDTVEVLFELFAASNEPGDFPVAISALVADPVC